jgi:glycosyltransferase involved in cell wall biosynthesis
MSFFTVIIPLYNKEKYIENAIKSVLNQTFTDFELVIIDDFSNDGSYEISKKYEELHNNIVQVYKNSKNSGVSFSRNEGISRATSDYIMFLDSIGMAFSAATIFFFRFRKLKPEGQPIYKMPLYPIMPIFYILAYIFIAASVFVKKPDAALNGLIIFAVFFFVFWLVFFWKRYLKKTKN